MIARKHRELLLYGITLAALLGLLKWLELRFIIVDHAFQIYAGSIALIFTGLGIWLALKLTKPKKETVVVEKTVYVSGHDFVLNEQAVEAHAISKRELEVLQLMAEGLSNDEIASRLFVSLSTVKTHAKNIYEKLDAGRRTQAIEKARRMGIIP